MTITADHSKQDRTVTQKPIYSPIFTDNIWSYLVFIRVPRNTTTSTVLLFIFKSLYSSGKDTPSLGCDSVRRRAMSRFVP